jgi:hypothetical protein
MSINVYWACLEEEWMRAEKPFPVYAGIQNRLNISETNIAQCPAFKESMKNLFALRSLYDYRFVVDKESNLVTSDMYNEYFLKEHVYVRSLKENSFSFSQYYSFFTEEKSLLITANIFPYLEDNSITKKCIIFPGSFDIGKYFRNIEFGFKIKDEYNAFDINRGDIYQYVKFHTDEKINFIQYRHTKELSDLMKETISFRNFKLKYSSLEEFYSFFKIKRMVIKEIKKNIIKEK